MIIEDGSSKIDSNSFVTADEYRDYYLSIGVDTSSETTQEIEYRLIQAAEYLQNLYEGQTKGVRSSNTQSLFFPRINSYFWQCLLDSNEIHQNIKKSQIISAFTFKNYTPYGVSITQKDIKKEVNKISADGLATEVEYFSAQESVSNPDLLKINQVQKLMAPFLKVGCFSTSRFPRSY